MKERAPAFQFYPRQFAGDDAVMAMDLDAIGAHILLMCAAAASPEQYRIRCRMDAGSMPEEYRTDTAERAIRTRLRNPSDEDWQRIKTQLLSGAWKVSDDGQWWEQDGLLRSFTKQRAFSEQQSERARQRWLKEHPEAMPNESRMDAEPLPEGMPEVCSSSASSSAKNNTRANSTPSTFDGEELVRKIQNAHPRFEQGQANAVAIFDAIQGITREKGMSDQVAAEYLYERTKLYRDCTANWPDKRMVTGSTRWFREGQFKQDESLWRAQNEGSATTSKRDAAFYDEHSPAKKRKARLEENENE